MSDHRCAANNPPSPETKTRDGIPLRPADPTVHPSGFAADPRVAAVLTRLRTAADTVQRGWRPASWHHWDGSRQSHVPELSAIDISPGSTKYATTIIDPPKELLGVALAGDQLQVVVRSIFPLRLDLDDKPLLEDRLPTVATGPAMLTVLESIGEANPTMQVTVHRPKSEGDVWINWLDLTFTTPRLRRRFELLDTAWSRILLAGELADDEPTARLILRAADLVPDDLFTTDDGALESALAAVGETLAPFRSRVRQIDVHVIGHAHIDLAWLWTWNDAKQVVARDVRSMLGIMRDFPEVTFTHSQPAGYKYLRDTEPELFAQIKEHIRGGRWEPATAQWVECDSNLVVGEAMSSQLREGVRFSEEMLGARPRVLLAPDTFGHSGNMPQLIRQAGATTYYHMRCNPGASKATRWPAYWWEGIDGTRVLAVSTSSYNGELTPGAVASAATDAIRAGHRAALLFVGVGDHGGGPTRLGYEALRRIGQTPGLPSARCSTIGAYVEQIAGVPLPVHRGESSTIFEGGYTTHTDVKQGNRHAENELATADALSVLAGLPADSHLAEAWRAVNFHQFHDIIAGSAVAAAYDLTHADHQLVRTAAAEITGIALSALNAGMADGVVVVTNPLGHRRDEVVVVPCPDAVSGALLVDDNGHRSASQMTTDGLAFRAIVDGFGQTSYRLEHGTDPTPGNLRIDFEGGTGAQPRYVRVQTKFFSCAIRCDNGIITSLFDRRADHELVAFGMQRPTDYGDTARPDLGLNVFQIVDERPHLMSSWQYQEVFRETFLIDGAHVAITETGPVRAKVTVRHTFGSSEIVEDIIFYRDHPRIDFTIDVDWHEMGGPELGIPNLKLSFMPDLDMSEAWFEIPYGAVPRRPNGQQVPALRWTDVGGPAYGVAVLNDSCYGNDILGSRTRLTLLRTAYAPDPRSDSGHYRFRVSLVPHQGNWRTAGVPKLAQSFNQPLLARWGTGGKRNPSPLWRPKVDVPTGSATTTLRTGRDPGAIVLRICEADGQQARVIVRDIPDNYQVWSSTILEDRGHLLRRRGSGDTVAVRLGPWQVCTVLLVPVGQPAPDVPVADPSLSIRSKE